MAECIYPEIDPIVPPDDPTPGGDCDCTKAQLLAILGYEEVEMTFTDVNNVTTTKIVLVKKEEGNNG